MTADLVPVLAAAFVLVVLFSFYISWRAGRLDRLHTRVETAHAALDAALLRRSAVVLEFACAGELEPASSVLLADAVGRTRRAADPGARELAESNLSRVLRAVAEEDGFGGARTGDDAGEDLPAEVEAAARRVHIARRFYNDAVAAIREARAGRLVRVLRLAGHAPMPDFFEMDDDPPVFTAA
ncbi:hypothetical protein HDA32_001642 [Spinactinospora alkalitolerans]|uniref:LemA family protein n=1 Tax=Spinactinospora alkalitolerans TaxID=687207 RepID=A0A852TUH6_9ACTN|nr:hypothetical protein [Spinactinospora alkalitolerans]NYE46522.1 hypothetical protein [Spinactinospora alkalitolerans]